MFSLSRNFLITVLIWLCCAYRQHWWLAFPETWFPSSFGFSFLDFLVPPPLASRPAGCPSLQCLPWNQTWWMGSWQARTSCSQRMQTQRSGQLGQAGRHTPGISALGKLWQDDQKFQASLGYLVRPCLTWQQTEQIVSSKDKCWGQHRLTSAAQTAAHYVTEDWM